MDESARRGVLPADDGGRIAGTPFVHKIRGTETGGRFASQQAVMAPGEWVLPHTHTREDEVTFVHRGTVGVLIGEQEYVAPEGSFIFKPRDVPHAMWNPTDAPAILIEFISPAGFEGFFEEVGQLELAGGADPASVSTLAARYGERLHPELLPRVLAALERAKHGQ